MKKIIAHLLVVVALGSFSVLARTATAQDGATAKVQKSSSPREEVKQTIDGLVKVVEAYPGEDKTKERRARLRELINPRFDFEEMARRSLGSFWNEATEEERGEFIKVFSDLLARTYLNRIETVRAGMVKIENEDVQSGESAPGESAAMKAVVKTMVTNRGDTFPISYKLLNKAGDWKVYDVIIENIGLVQNYRNEFASIIRKEKMAGLLKRLRDKNASNA